ncbi:MAG: PaaX family transcriptional regulator C-terminal domain-containing protein [Patescibacteria group bacterium]|nr:PaaX family transcriptional regulator C-terminal domain-containing protein [Patescibacteria group bacterium]
MRGLFAKLDKLVFTNKDRIIRDAIYRGKQRGWIKEDFTLTKEGKERIFRLIPQFFPPKHWDGQWYLAVFDIPEKMRRKRDILRENLKKLGFGQLQQSIWISAVNYLGNVEEIIKFYQLQDFVILAQTDKLGKETSKVLANRIWKLEKINRSYIKFIDQWQEAGKEEKFWLLFKYFNILRKDPQLPLELLPNNWQGIKAHQLIKKYLKDKKL